MNTETKLDKALNLVQENGYAAVHPLSVSYKPYISKLSELVENSGYRLDKAEIERNENNKATGRILLAVYPFEILEKIEWEQSY